MDLARKQVTVFGLGESGLAAARVLAGRGAKVFITEVKDETQLADKIDFLTYLGVDYELGGHTEQAIRNAELIIVSPGVSLDIPILVQARAMGIPIVSEIELAYRLCPAPIIAVTGTNGKTTTTMLIGEILKKDGRSVKVAGNIGSPLVLAVVGVTIEDLIVAEVSSFQLEAIDEFKPKISIFLNIADDHLDRHKSFLEYFQAKKRILENQNSQAYAILNYDNFRIRELVNQTQAKICFFSRNQALKEGVYTQNGRIYSSLDSRSVEICPLDLIKLKGQHNLENVLAAVAAALIYEVKIPNLVSALGAFKGLEHRLEEFAELNGIKFINDSKATNPDATIKAIQAYQPPIILIAGGKDKNFDFYHLGEITSKYVNLLIVLGESAHKISQAAQFSGFKDVLEAKNLEEAVELAYAKASPGTTVLLSPACASFDMFKDFEERGNTFKQAVRRLKERVGT